MGASQSKQGPADASAAPAPAQPQEQRKLQLSTRSLLDGYLGVREGPVLELDANAKVSDVALPAGKDKHSLELWCPACSRPCALEVREFKTVGDEVVSLTGPGAKKPRYAFVVCLWGESLSYVLGAAVLVRSLKKHTKRDDVDFVCLFAEDPENEKGRLKPEAREILTQAGWDLRIVYHLWKWDWHFFDKDNRERFEHVFTKLHVLNLTEYEKVCCLDIDMMVFHDISDVFDLQAPAAMKRMQYDEQHGQRLDGKAFFCYSQREEDYRELHRRRARHDTYKQNRRENESFVRWPESELDLTKSPYAFGKISSWNWCQGSGINAGLMLLPTDGELFDQLEYDIADPKHPGHVWGAGPEQDFLSRFFADRWRHVDVSYNYQLHQMFIALRPFGCSKEGVLQTLGKTSDSFNRRLDLIKNHEREIRVIHYSGESGLKPWDFVVSKKELEGPSTREAMEVFTLKVLEGFEGYLLWVAKDEEAWRRNLEFDEKNGWSSSSNTYGWHLVTDGATGKKSIVAKEDPELVFDLGEEVENKSRAVIKSSYNAWYTEFCSLREECAVLQTLFPGPEPVVWAGEERAVKKAKVANKYDTDADIKIDLDDNSSDSDSSSEPEDSTASSDGDGRLARARVEIAKTQARLEEVNKVLEGLMSAARGEEGKFLRLQKIGGKWTDLSKDFSKSSFYKCWKNKRYTDLSESLAKPLAVNITSHAGAHVFRVGTVSLQLEESYNVVRLSAEEYFFGAVVTHHQQIIVRETTKTLELQAGRTALENGWSEVEDATCVALLDKHLRSQGGLRPEERRQQVQQLFYADEDDAEKVPSWMRVISTSDPDEFRNLVKEELITNEATLRSDVYLVGVELGTREDAVAIDALKLLSGTPTFDAKGVWRTWYLLAGSVKHGYEGDFIWDDEYAMFNNQGARYGLRVATN